jgi:hypothetical protein
MTHSVLHLNSLVVFVLLALIAITGCGTYGSTQNMDWESVVGHYEGTAGENYIPYSEQLTLNNDSTFVWFRDVHMLRLESFGKWRMSNNKIILQSHQSIKDPAIHILDKWTEQADSVIFHIEDIQGEPIPFIVISTGNKKEYVSNTDGKIYILKDDFVPPVEIKAAYAKPLLIEDYLLTHNRFKVQVSYSHTDTNISMNNKILVYRKHIVSRQPFLQWQDGNIKLEKVN